MENTFAGNNINLFLFIIFALALAGVVMGALGTKAYHDNDHNPNETSELKRIKVNEDLVVNGISTISRLADLTPTYTVVTAATLTAVAGNEYALSRAAGIAVTLPAATPVARIIISIPLAITSNATTITAAAGDFLVGYAYTLATADAAPSTKSYFAPNGTSNLIISLNGTTTGGLVGSYIELVGISTTQWRVRAELLGSGTLVTPFS